MELHFHVADYIVMGAFLLISLAIGIYYGVVQKQRTTEEYLLGNRKMQLIPVALSMLVTYQSAISVIGTPAEVYLYNTMFLYIYLGIAVANVIQYFMIVPLMYPLRLTSTYEYLGRRFDSRAVQLTGTALGMLQTLLYMSIVLLAPALALEAVAGIPLWISVVLVGIIGTIYTSLGGIKSVVWTDVFQFIILFAGLIAILILSRIKLGSFNNIWGLAVKGHRVVFDNINGDPRVRHSVWSLIIGGAFNWLPNCCNQSAVQRICSMKNLKQSKIAIFLNMPLVIVYGTILCLTGVVMYAYFAAVQCDPLAEGILSNGNQVTPYFVMHVLTDLPGLAGIFIAALFSGSLSSLSSGINAMAANTLEDLLVHYFKKMSQWRQMLAAKLIVVVYGAVAVTLAYLAKDLTGPITQIGLSAIGAVGGPVVGVIFLGGIFPQANWIGAIGGVIVGFGINVWISIGSVLYGTKSPRSPTAGVQGCFENQTIWLDSTNSVTKRLTTAEMVQRNVTEMNIGYNSNGHVVLYDLSYLYFGMIGFFVTFIVGLLISICVGVDKYATEPEYIFPCMRDFWRAGCKGTKAAPVYQVYKMQQKVKIGISKEGEVPVVSPVKPVDLTWYNKLPEAEL